MKPGKNSSLCNLGVLCVSVVSLAAERKPQRHRGHRVCTEIILIFLLLLLPTVATAQMKTSESLTEKQASHFAALALKCVSREVPNKPEHVINNASEVSSPKILHPAFYGCYDWHSSVHGHWMLVRLLKMFPNLPESAQVRAALGANLTAENIS